MLISGIDKDFEDIIPYVDEKGLKPFASCDGVLAHHTPDKKPLNAYVAFLQSEEIASLMAAFLMDAETFNIHLRSETSKDPIFLYGNEIKGNTFMVYFENFNGERTEYFKKIIRGVLDHSIFLNNESLSLIENIINALEDSQHKHDNESEKSDICYDIELNSIYHTFPGTNKNDRKINSIRISTKSEYGYFRNMHDLAQLLSKKYGFLTALEDRHMGKIQDEEFIQVFPNGVYLYVYLKDDKLPMIAEIIELVHSIEDKLETVQLPETPDLDDIEYFE